VDSYIGKYSLLYLFKLCTSPCMHNCLEYRLYSQKLMKRW